MKYILTIISIIILSIPSKSQTDTTMYIPNSFTANNDGKNDAWKTFSNTKWDNFLVEVYNLWGDCIWYTTDPNEWWMGESDMDEPNYYSVNGSYYYVVTYNIGSNTFRKFGHITKIR